MNNLIRLQFFLLLNFLVVSLFAQQKADGLIWSEKKLIWTDFKEDNSVEKYPGSLARSFVKVHVTDIDTTLHHEKNGINVKVYALFFPTLSWARKSSIGKSSVLAHEQLHFDIGELIARRLRKQLSLQYVSCKNYEAVINKLKKKAFSQLGNMNFEYDKTHKQKWQKWVDDISNELAELDKYKSVEVLIPLENK